MDVLLLPLLQPAQEPGTESELARLVEEHAAPIIKGIVAGKLHARTGDQLSRQEAEDLYGEVIVQLLTRLRALVSAPDEHPIGDFRSYVAVTTYNACNLRLRKKYPARWRLKSRLRYTLLRHDDFALWQAGGRDDCLCGFRAWGGRTVASADGARRLHRLADEPDSQQMAALSAVAQHSDLPGLLRAVFNYAAAPVPLDDLLGIIAGLLGVQDRVMTVDISDEQNLAGRPGGSAAPAGLAAEVERRSYLRRLWDEITRLPPAQRASLLLNLRDAQEGVVALLPLSGVATIRQIAEAVGMPAEQFAGLWNQLPLEDAAIADLLGVTRQQVINLRKSARARLARRMRQLDRPR